MSYPRWQNGGQNLKLIRIMKLESFAFDAAPPYPAGVEVAELLAEIEAVIKKHVVLSEEEAAALAVGGFGKGPRSKVQSHPESERDETGLTKYSCWCPKVISLIGEVPDTIADRSIVVKMTRKLTSEMGPKGGMIGMLRHCAS
jgi:hypothetical protein